MGERIRRVKVRKLVGWENDSFIGKAKAAHTSKANQGIHSLLPIGRQVFSHLQESKATSRVMVTWEDKRHHSECPLPSSFFPQLCMLSVTSYGMEYPFGQLGHLSQPCHLPAFRASGSMRSQKVLGCLATTKNISMSSPLFSSQIQNAALYQLPERKLSLSQPKPGQ